MNHLTDRQLERWLRSKDNFDPDEATYISEHLESCHLCRERLDTLQSYYNDLERKIEKSPGEKERSIASKIYRRRTQNALPAGSLIQTYQKTSVGQDDALPVRIKNYLQKHPVSSASITVGTALFAALLFMILPWQGNDNPVYAEVERNVLHVYNQEGEPIWNRVANGLPNEIDSKTEYIRIADIDGDDTNEVLITGKNNKGYFTQNTVYCFNSDGTLRWEQNPPAPIMFGKRTHSRVSTWDVSDFFSMNSSDGNSHLFVTSNSSWFSSVLFELNPLDGDIVQTYWHPGWIWTSEIYQNEDNDRSFILLGTTNNTYQKAALVVLDPGKIEGHAPVTEVYKTEETSRADEVHYVMFQPSLLNQLYSQYLYNMLIKIKITDNGGLLVRAEEKWGSEDTDGFITYTLDSNFRALEAHGSATYEKTYVDLFKEGELSEPLTDQYWEHLKDSVMYWDDTTSSFIRHAQLEE